MKFSVKQQNKIAYCIVDNTLLAKSGWASEISKNISDSFLHKTISHGYDVFINTSEDDLLLEVAQEEFYTHAVLVASGTSLKLSEKLFEAVEDKCKEEFTLAGHILDRGDAYYELHHQFIIVRLSDYVELGKPALGVATDNSHLQVVPVRCKDNVHDDYVPLWISKGSDTKLYTSQLHGWNLLSTMLEADKRIVDLGQAIRDSKQYLYYEYDHVFIKHLPDIYYYDFFCVNFPHHSNTDNTNTMQFDGPVEQYVSIGTGYNWVYFLSKFGFTEDTEVIFTDVNPNCLRLMEAMVTTWDGKDYRQLYEGIVKPLVPTGPIHISDEYYQQAHDKWVEFRNNFPEWDEVWEKVKQLKFKFVLIDYMAAYNLNWLSPNKKTFMNVSDLFTYASAVSLHPLKYRVACENRLIESLQEKNNNIMLHFSSRACAGFTNNQLLHYGLVSQFELTDINTLHCPQWHLPTGWHSLRTLR
jgi:hypothetical protein